MSLITRNNYEAYMLDYVEENLSPELVMELMLFLEQNPTLKEELEDFEIHALKPVSTPLFDKSDLKKDNSVITVANYEDFIIAEVEGVNSIENSTALMLFLNQNPTINKEYLAFQKTKLVGETILFANKKALKKKTGLVILMNWVSSSAAAILIILLSFNWIVKEDPVYSPLSDNIDVHLNTTDFDGNILVGSIILEEEQFAIKEKAIPKQEKNEEAIEKSVLKDIENNNSSNKQNQFANLPEEKKKDEVDLFEIENQKEEIFVNEEMLVIENSVTITYEDELFDDGIPNPVKRKITKLDLVRAAVKHKVNGNLNKGKEKVLFAFNSKPLNFIRKNKKK